MSGNNVLKRSVKNVRSRFGSLLYIKTFVFNILKTIVCSLKIEHDYQLKPN